MWIFDHQPSHWLIQALGRALVDGCTKQKENYNVVWGYMPVKLSFILHHQSEFMSMNILLKVGILSAVLLAGCSKPVEQQQQDREPVLQSENQLPAMSITMLNGSSLNIKSLTGKIMLILFQTDCDHCQREAKEIRDNMEAFENYAVYFITADQISAIEKFGKDHDLLNHPNVSFGMATVTDVLNNFGSIPTPSVYVYIDQQLKHKFNGEVSIERIVAVL